MVNIYDSNNIGKKFMITLEQQKYIRNNYLDTTYKEIAFKLGISMKQVQRYVTTHLKVKDLKVSKAVKTRLDINRINQDTVFKNKKLVSELKHCLLRMKLFIKELEKNI